MLKLQNSANLKFYYLIPGFSTDFKKRKDLFNDGIKYFFDLNEEEGYEIAIEKISLSKFLFYVTFNYKTQTLQKTEC